MRWPSHTHTLLELALNAAREAGARVELLDIRLLELPIYEPFAGHPAPAVTELRELVADAHALLIGTPEYHGGMSGALKNVFDYLYPEVNGKLLGLVVATGTDMGTSAVGQLREMAGYLGAWTLPAAVTAGIADFDEAGQLANPRVVDRLQRLGRDLTVYGEQLFERFRQDSVSGGGPEYGFAPLFVKPS